MNKELHNYTYLKKGSEEGKRRIDGGGIFIMILSLIAIFFVALPINSNIFNSIYIFGFIFLMGIWMTFDSREQIKYVEYINSNGKIKKIYEKDWEENDT